MSEVIKIGQCEIGLREPVFIIAEVGVNHNGDLELAKELIREAARCGADCVKFQTFKAERVALENAPKADYQLKTTEPEESQTDMLRKLETRMEDYAEIIECCREEGVVFISTPYNVEDVDFLESLGVPAYKLASMHAVEPSFVKYTAAKGQPIILSTGMATLGEVEIALNAIKDAGNSDVILLQCTTNYPSRLEDTNLLAMNAMANEFNVMVGYSDHTPDDTACIVAVGLGARVIEKHFTLDKSLSGPDQSTSADPEEFEKLVKSVRKAELVLGSSIKQPCKIEKENSLGMRRSIAAKCKIAEGDEITENMLTFKRPASGISPLYISEVIGKHALKNISENDFIEWAHINASVKGSK